TAGQGRRRRQLLLELQNGDALPFGRRRNRLLASAPAERQGVAHRPARGDGQGQTAQQGDFKGFGHGWRPEGVKSGSRRRGRRLSRGRSLGRSSGGGLAGRRRRQGRSGRDDGGQVGGRARVDGRN